MIYGDFIVSQQAEGAPFFSLHWTHQTIIISTWIECTHSARTDFGIIVCTSQTEITDQIKKYPNSIDSQFHHHFSRLAV